MVPIAEETVLVSVEQYLSQEKTSSIKHELVGGRIYAMAGASANHDRIAGNIYRQFGNHLEGSPCEPFGSDMKVKIRDDFFYPDVLIDCQFDDSEPYFTETPKIIVEVISKSTRHNDRGNKLLSYINIPSLEDYVLVEQDFVSVDVLSRKNGWIPRNYDFGDDIRFDSISLTMSVEDIYHRVQNEEMMELLKDKNC